VSNCYSIVARGLVAVGTCLFRGRYLVTGLHAAIFNFISLNCYLMIIVVSGWALLLINLPTWCRFFSKRWQLLSWSRNSWLACNVKNRYDVRQGPSLSQFSAVQSSSLDATSRRSVLLFSRLRTDHPRGSFPKVSQCTFCTHFTFHPCPTHFTLHGFGLQTIRFRVKNTDSEVLWYVICSIFLLATCWLTCGNKTYKENIISTYMNFMDIFQYLCWK
jgi:hypothetical protein